MFSLLRNKALFAVCGMKTLVQMSLIEAWVEKNEPDLKETEHIGFAIFVLMPSLVI
jgi:hypothetical protein